MSKHHIGTYYPEHIILCDQGYLLTILRLSLAKNLTSQLKGTEKRRIVFVSRLILLWLCHLVAHKCENDLMKNDFCPLKSKAEWSNRGRHVGVRALAKLIVMGNAFFLLYSLGKSLILYNLKKGYVFYIF